MALTVERPPVLAVVQQHQEDAANLRATRQGLVSAPHVRLHHLRRLDDRIAAHLDGLAVAGRVGAQLCDAALASPGVGEVFTATVRAIEDRNAAALARLMSLAEAEAASATGLLSAFGWVSAASLRGITKELLSSRSAFQRQVGLAACGMHQADPGAALDAALNDADPALRCRALRVAGELGRIDALPRCLRALAEPAGPVNDTLRFHAARSALLLGDRGLSAAALERLAETPGTQPTQALDLWLMVASPEQAHATLKRIAQKPAHIRTLIVGVGVAGDAHYVPWLIQQMADLKLARRAGEAFSTITGLDLAYLDLETKPPQQVDVGPNDDPAEDEVAIDEDDSLPWPDAAKIAGWWRVHGPRFAPGTRHFMGEPVVPAHGLAVLKTGFQRQRQAAALYLRLMKPGLPLFNTAAPAWRQQRLLAHLEM